MTINEDNALLLLNHYIKNEKMLIHSYATEAVMRALAGRLGQDENKWGLAGLLHDLDIELVDGDLSRHGLEAERILKEEGAEPEVIEAVVMHNEMASGKQRNTIFQHALVAAETITGLIVATALVYPDKKLASVKAKSVTKRMKEKLFAASVSRERIMECEKLGLTLDEFAEISLAAMKAISSQLEL